MVNERVHAVGSPRDADDASPFTDEQAPAGELPPGRPDPRAMPCKAAIVAYEPEAHPATLLARAPTFCSNRNIDFLSAHSAAAARDLLARHPDAALVLLDVVMETDDSGLELIKYIREQLCNGQIRVVLRTGQPGQAPEATVIRDYDI